MCFKAPKVKDPPRPVAIDQSKVESEGDLLGRRLSVRRGYAASIATSPSGASNFGQAAQVPGLAPGGSPTLGS